jgi:hypothetical protein
VDFRVHCLASEKLPPFYEYNHAGFSESNGACHQSQDRWDETILDCPVIEEEDHSELLLSAWLTLLCFSSLTPKVFLTIVADTMICPGICS